MKELTMKEKIAFSLIFNEKRVYHRWYGRWFVFGLWQTKKGDSTYQQLVSLVSGMGQGGHEC